MQSPLEDPTTIATVTTAWTKDRTTKSKRPLSSMVTGMALETTRKWTVNRAKQTKRGADRARIPAVWAPTTMKVCNRSLLICKLKVRTRILTSFLQEVWAPYLRSLRGNRMPWLTTLWHRTSTAMAWTPAPQQNKEISSVSWTKRSSVTWLWLSKANKSLLIRSSWRLAQPISKHYSAMTSAKRIFA